MADPEKRDRDIYQMLANLHDELENTKALNEKERSMMRHLMADIQETLRHSNPKDLQTSSSLVDRLNLAVDELAVSHPTLTAMIERALETLNMAGI